MLVHTAAGVALTHTENLGSRDHLESILTARRRTQDAQPPGTEPGPCMWGKTQFSRAVVQTGEKMITAVLTKTNIP